MTKEELLEHYIIVAEEDFLENIKYLSDLGFKLLCRYTKSKGLCLVYVSDYGLYYSDLKYRLEAIPKNELPLSNLYFSHDGTLLYAEVINDIPFFHRVYTFRFSINPPFDYIYTSNI